MAAASTSTSSIKGSGRSHSSAIRPCIHLPPLHHSIRSRQFRFSRAISIAKDAHSQRLQISGFRNGRMHRVVGRLMALIDDLAMTILMAHPAAHYLYQSLRRQMHGAGCRKQQAITSQQTHRLAVELAVGTLAVGNILAPLDEGRRVENYHIELLAIGLEGSQGLESIALAYRHLLVQAVERGVLGHPLQRRGTGVHAQHLAGTMRCRLYTPATDVAEHVEDTLARHQTVEPGAIGTMIEKPAGLLAIEYRHMKAHAVLFHQHRTLEVTLGQGDLTLQLLQPPPRRVILEHDDPW